MAARPFVLLSCGTSIDGCLDDGSAERLLLSNDADFDRVDASRAECDAILVGAGTVRRDDPRLLVRSPQRRAARVARGLPPSPLRVTLTARGALDPAAQFFTAGDAGDPVDLPRLLADLHARGVRRLMVEGGESVHTQFLGAGLVDELHLVIAPFFVGEARAPRLVGGGRFPRDPGRRATLVEVRRIEDVVLLRYTFPTSCPHR